MARAIGAGLFFMPGLMGWLIPMVAWNPGLAGFPVAGTLTLIACGVQMCKDVGRAHRAVGQHARSAADFRIWRESHPFPGYS